MTIDPDPFAAAGPLEDWEVFQCTIRARAENGEVVLDETDLLSPYHATITPSEARRFAGELIRAADEAEATL